MLLSPEESLALWPAGGPLSPDVLDWARTRDKPSTLVAASKSVTEQKNLLAQCRRNDHQLALKVAVTSEGVRARITITLLNGRTISSSFDLVKNKMGNDLDISDEADTQFEQLTTNKDPCFPDRQKHLMIDCSEKATAGDVIVRMTSTDLIGYYAFDQIPTRIIKDTKAIIGEAPYPVVHLWDYLHGQPLSVHLKPFQAVDNTTIPPCFTGSLAGGLPIYADLTPKLLETYTSIFAHRTANMVGLR